MALLYQPPQNPYAGTENGSAGNVFCKQIATASFIDGGVGFVIQANAATYVATPGADWDTTDTVTTLAIPPSTTTLSAGSSGSGMTATFTVVGSGANQTASQILVVVSNPGTNYQVGDVLQWSDAVVAAALVAALFAVVQPVNTITIGGANANPLELTIAAARSGGVVTTVEADETGWQFSLNSVSALTQLVTIVIPDNGIAGDDFAEQDYCIVTNLTGGIPETATTTIGTLTASIYHDTVSGTELISLRRVTGSAASTLLPADCTVRLVKRMLPVV